MAMADYKYALFISHLESNYRGFEYAVYTEDPGMLHILDYHFYNFLWIPCEVIMEAGIKARNFADVWKAIEFSEALVKKGMKVLVKVRGKEVNTRKDRQVEGILLNTIVLHPGPHIIPVYSLTIKDTEDKVIKIGGRGAVVEDIEAFEITIIPQ
jgi:hypothetical protein